jgi:hypothetical protein
MLAACGTGEGASYVVLDEPARAALVEVEAGGRAHTGALPLEVEGGMTADLVTPNGRRPLRTAPGMVYEVRGAATEVLAWRLGVDVRSDAVEVGGPEGVVRPLATALGARPPQPWNGRWRLEGADVLLRLSWMGDVAEISPVALVLTEPARERARAEWRMAPGAVRSARLEALVPDAAQAALVGLYTSDVGQSLFLDAEGGFVLQKDCDPSPVRGSYRSHQGRVELDGTDLALTIDGAGRLEAPGLVFSTGEGQ